MARSNLQNSRTGANLAQATRLMADGKTARAERILRKLLKSDPGNAEALHLAGVARHRVGKPGQAADLVEKAIRAEPRDARFHRTLGDILHAGGRDERAAECYRAVTALDPGDADTHAALAGALMGLDRIDETLESYRAALRIEPGDITALFDHGNAFAPPAGTTRRWPPIARCWRYNPIMYPSIAILADCCAIWAGWTNPSRYCKTARG